MYFVKTSAEFSSAHRLVDYEGDCRKIHGHNWRVDFNVWSDKLDELGMVADFKELREIAKQFDHKLILQNCKENIDLFGDLELQVGKNWIEWLEFTPTAEKLAEFFASETLNWFKHVKKVRVYVWENRTSNASHECER